MQRENNLIIMFFSLTFVNDMIFYFAYNYKYMSKQGGIIYNSE